MASARLPAGDYRLVFTGKATYYKSTEVNGRKIRQGPFEVFLTASSGGRLELPFSFVKVTRLECGGVTVTDNPNDHIIHRLRIPCGYYGTGRITATATPSSLEWPLGYPVWGGEILSSYDGTAQVDVSSPGHSTLSATCGNTLSMDVSVIGVNDLLAAVVPQNTNLSSYWRSHYTSGVQEGYIESGSFKGNDEHKYLFLEVQDAWLTVLAEPTPDAVTYVLTNGSNLPSAWTFTGGQGNSKVIRHIDASVPGVTRFHAQCGTSERRLTIGIAGVDIRGDVNHDGQITAADNGRVVNQDGTEGDEMENIRPGVLLTVPSPDDTDDERRRRFAEIRLVPIGLQAVSAMEENQMPDSPTPAMSLDYDTSRVEVFDAPVNGQRIEPGQPLPHHSELTVYARGVRPRWSMEAPCRITVNYHSRLFSCSDSLVVTVLNVNPTMANGGFLLVNDDNDDMGDGNIVLDTHADYLQNGPLSHDGIDFYDDDLQYANFPFDIAELHDELCQCTVTFSMEGSGGVNVFSDRKKSFQMLHGATATECEAVNRSGMLAVHYPNSQEDPDTSTGKLRVAVEGTARSESVKGTRLVATWKVGQVELRGILPLTVLQMQMAVDGGKHEDEINFNYYGNKQKLHDFGNYRCVFWANTDYDAIHFQDELAPESDAWLEDDWPNDKDADGSAIPRNCNDDHIGWRGKHAEYIHVYPDGQRKVWRSPSNADNWCLRDLEDFNRLHMRFDPLFATMDNVRFSMSSSGVSINLFPAVNPNLSYLKDKTEAEKQAKKKRLLTTGGDEATLDADWLTFGVDNDIVTAFLWEGCAYSESDERAGYVYLNAYVNSQLVGTKKVRIILKDVANYYDVWESASISSSQAFVAQLESLRTQNAKCWPNANDEYLLLCHGFNVDSDDKTFWPRTVFKRLWWQNYPGRFGFFSWPCKVKSEDGTYPKLYDDSDFEAWNTGEILKNLLEGLVAAEFNVHLLAHSQGNVVAGNALRQFDAAQRIATYIASQAAISLSCYDHVQQAYFSTQRVPDVRADYPGWSDGNPFLSNVRSKVTKMVNFYNTQDYALESAWLISWKRNNRMRPDYDYDYEGSSTEYNTNPKNGKKASRFYKSSGLILPTGQTDLIFPSSTTNHQSFSLADTYEIFSYAAHAWGEPIGMLSQVVGFDGFSLEENGLKYNDRHYSHSRQFRSNILAERPYWENVSRYCKINPGGISFKEQTKGEDE